MAMEASETCPYRNLILSISGQTKEYKGNYLFVVHFVPLWLLLSALRWRGARLASKLARCAGAEGYMRP